MRDKRPWTTHEQGVLRNLWSRLRPDEIAEELDRTVWSVYSKARELGLPNSHEGSRGGARWSEMEERALRLMVAYGVPLEEIAEALQRGLPAIKRRIRK